MSVGRRDVYYTTWSGPGLYTVNAGTGHVRWQFPLDNWFRYWVKDIDLPASASFSYAEEVKDLVYVTAPGPPSRMYGLKAKSGSRRWEFKSPVASAALADLAGPAYSSSRARTRTLFLAYNAPGPATGPGGASNSSSWLQALDIDRGAALWRSEPLQQMQLQQLDLHRETLVAMPAAADALYGFNYSDGELMWSRQRQFCSTPSPIAESYGGQLVLASSCSGPFDLAVMGAETARFPASSQQWGMRALQHEGLAIFLAEDRVYAVDAYWGNLSWSLKLEIGDTIQPWQQPALEVLSGTLLLTALRPSSNKTAVAAISLTQGKLIWRRTVNGSAQQPAGPSEGPQQLWLYGGHVYVEACKGTTCCLRAFNVSSGKRRWGVCLDAQRGQDATHPHAQFAIWVITLVTVASIALLIVGAALLYVHRWSEERKILEGDDDGSSPRHTYRPLPDRGDGSDSEGEGTAERFRARNSGGVAAAAAAGRSGSGFAVTPFAQPLAAAGLQQDQQQQQQQLYPGLGRVGGPAAGGQSGRFVGQRGIGEVAATAAADVQAIGQHQEAVWVQERGAISGMARARVPADDEPNQPDSG
ncbi:hypothetical protein OEZ86_004849 [Tetradesmus obliquus]|nr:hypothetical protein OEZ86_004849 [Tetradesmus obliquus]